MQAILDIRNVATRVEELYQELESCDYSRVAGIEQEVRRLVGTLPYYANHVYDDINREATKRRAVLQKVQYDKVMADIASPEPEVKKVVKKVKKTKKVVKKVKKTKKVVKKENKNEQPKESDDTKSND